MKQIKPELLAPAGNLKKLQYAIAYGADAIYCGLPEFSLRYRINMFDYKTLKQGIDFAHKHNKKVYITVNIYPHKQHLTKLAKHITKLKTIKPDALIVSDPGILSYIKEVWPNIHIHLSTQANCTNWRSAKFWFEQGVKRIILARETTLDDIKEIHKNVPELELETFVHGAMCMSYSGRCILSKWFTDRSANLGDCSQPCRWNFKLQTDPLVIEESQRKGSYFPIEQDAHGTYIMNSKDLNLIKHLKQLQKAGISSFKIEGRAKSIYYLGNTLHAYREAIDNQKSDLDSLFHELEKAPNRGFTQGFIFGEKEVSHRFESSHENSAWEFCGEVVGYDKKNEFLEIAVHNAINQKDLIEIIVPFEKNITLKLSKIYNHKFESILEAHGGQETKIYLPYKKPLPLKSLLRRKI
ncbi:hypothetical protein A2300_02950 [Candidatus Falkowbacteria bacterium RIFOXYB2_FULL_35_7]|nr:MAG: hypothetical protein A2300_02950 [Candidatus Falkowbacteria bacterium RIFOXYB2_FULL_35_7]